MPDLTDTFYESKAFHGYGAQLLVGAGDSTPGPESFMAIAEILTITPGSMDTANIDKTHLRSPEAHKESMPGLRETGAFGLSGNWVPDEPTHSNNAGSATAPVAAPGLVALSRSREVRNFIIRLPYKTGTPAAEMEWPFQGYISKFQPGEIGTEDKVNFTAEVMPVRDISAALP